MRKGGLKSRARENHSRRSGDPSCAAQPESPSIDPEGVAYGGGLKPEPAILKRAVGYLTKNSPAAFPKGRSPPQRF
ncbi:MAG: hypothetical protein ACJA1L_001303 [Paracoccaceae bacterium]|jgi:hypothetical protein